MLFIDLLQDNEGNVYWMMLCLNNYKLMNFKFWEFIDMIDEFEVIFNLNYLLTKGADDED